MPCSSACICRLTPTSEYSCDGSSLDPVEVMFVKVKSYMVSSEISFSKKALKYEHWQQQVRPSHWRQTDLLQPGHVPLSFELSECAWSSKRKWGTVVFGLLECMIDAVVIHLSADQPLCCSLLQLASQASLRLSAHVLS